MKTTGYSRVAKDLIIKEIEKEFKARPIFFVVQHGTTSATSLDKLRAKLRSANSRYFVVKNSLAIKAMEKTNFAQYAEGVSGSCGIAFTSSDPVLSSKVLVDFSKENEAFKIQNGCLNGEMMTLAQIKTLANLPSREVLLARVLGGMQAPVSRFAGVLAGTLRKFVTVLDAIAKKKQG